LGRSRLLAVQSRYQVDAVDDAERDAGLAGLVDEVVVFGVPDAEWGERVSALVVPEPGVSPPDAEPDPATGRRLDREELLDFVRDRLAAYKLPKTIAVADGLPRTVSGTVDRAAVRNYFSSGSSATSNGSDAGSGDSDEASEDDEQDDDSDDDGEAGDPNSDSGQDGD
jgi:O-succinylbenzoic acid--CoA ligase